MMAVSTPLRYRRSLTFSVGPRVTIGRTCTAPPSFTTRAISVAKRMGAPSRRPPARPIVPALSRSRICASPEMADEVRRDCAILEPQSASVTINTVISLVKKVIIIPFNENQYAARLIIPPSTLRLLSAAHLPLKKEREACHFIAPGYSKPRRLQKLLANKPLSNFHFPSNVGQWHKTDAP